MHHYPLKISVPPPIVWRKVILKKALGNDVTPPSAAAPEREWAAAPQTAEQRGFNGFNLSRWPREGRGSRARQGVHSYPQLLSQFMYRS